MEKQFQDLIKKVDKKFKPISIFLYGSRARTDFLEYSDYEVGLLYSSKQEISRTELKKFNPIKSIIFYPFEYESFLKYIIDTPFPEIIYFRELILGGKTISGQKVIEELKPPPVKILDLLQRISFDIGVAFAAVLSYRRGDLITAGMEFSKSCLFGIRCLIILQHKAFPLNYDEIYQASLKLKLGPYSQVVKHALDVRQGKKLSEASIYHNISLLNEMVKEKILEVFEKKGNIIVLN
ncbi:nucleotidyltransferase domain-containing protein [Patescibacteria group bacterium]|nr:nucleotidyltransferase domain-containing protein [Patescibacteria group bacterium]